MNKTGTDNSYKRIGKIIQTLGLNGRVVMTYETSSAEPLLRLSHWFVALQQGSYIPFFPEGSQQILESGKLVWQPDEIFSAEAAKALVGKEVYLETKVFKKLFPANSLLEEDFVGFKIKDSVSGNTATIESIISVSGQLLAQVHFHSDTILLPMAEDFIKDINLKKKTIEMNLPEGIWDL